MATSTGEHSSTVQAAEKGIFDGVYFAVIPTNDLSDEETNTLTESLTTNGATHCPLSSSQLRHVTHLIATTSDFPAYHDAVDGFIHVVRPLWVEQSILKKKAANPRQYSPDPSFFLSEVVLTCAEDIPDGDRDAIIGGLHAMGGLYSVGLTKLVTHVVGLTIHSPQYKTIVDRKLKCLPVLPHWFDDCLKLGKKIGVAPYLLPDPPMLSGQKPRPSFTYTASPGLLGATRLTPPPLADPLPPPASPSKERRELAVFRNKSVLLHKDLELSSRLNQSLTDIIKRGGGRVIEDVKIADMLICQYRDSPDFLSASKAGKDVGNLSWLYYLINQNMWTSPMRRLLHYPVPKQGIEGFSELKISVSNYTGEARIYLESLVKAAGGNYTKNMAQDNTHLITAHTFSEKCVAAKEWNIHLVNHLWLEESYAKGKIQSMTVPKYTTFPEQTNLCEVVGQTPIDREAVADLYFPRKDTSAGHLEPIEFNSSIARTPAMKDTKQDGKKKNIQTPVVPLRLNGDVIATPGSRGAKDRALSKLQSMAPDIALFEKESKRVGGVVYGGRKVTDPDRIVLQSGPVGRKRLSNDADVESFSEEGDEHQEEGSEHAAPPKRKKAKTSKQAAPILKTTEPPLKVLVTGYDRDGVKATAVISAKLAGLNINIVEDATSDIDVLAAPKILRTRKFLTGVTAAPAIVNVTWLEDMVAKQRRLPLDDYALQDPDTENTVAFNLKDALERARINKAAGGMLKGYTIFCTDSVKAGFETYEGIIKANGGSCLLFKGRVTKVPWTKNGEQHRDRDSTMAGGGEEKEYLYLITDLKDKEKTLWPKFREMAVAEGYEPRVVKPDWLLRIAQSQEAEEWQDEWEYV